MDSDTRKIMSATDGAIVEGAVRREEKRDIGEMIAQVDRYLKMGAAASAIKGQWHIITALVQTIVKLEKRNLLMLKDYRNGKSRR